MLRYYFHFWSVLCDLDTDQKTDSNLINIYDFYTYVYLILVCFFVSGAKNYKPAKWFSRMTLIQSGRQK